jgi:hypothetical protein
MILKFEVIFGVIPRTAIMRTQEFAEHLSAMTLEQISIISG